MDMRRPGPESSSSGEGHDTTQHASGAGPSTERSTNVDALSSPAEGSLASTVTHQPSSLPSPSVPSQTHIQLQHDPTSPPPPQHIPTATIPQPETADTNISTLTAPRPPTIITIMHGSASAVRPPIPLEPRTNTTLAEHSRSGGETVRLFDQTGFWETEASPQNLMERLENMTARRNESIEALARTMTATATPERMMLVIQRDRTAPVIASGSGTAGGATYQLMIERQGTGGSFPAVHTGTSGPETTVLPPRSPQRPGRGLADDDDGVTLRGRRVMMMAAHQASSGNSRQSEPRQNLPTTERLPVVINSDSGSVASLPSRQLPSPFTGTANETTPLLPSPSATPPTVIRVSTPTTIESYHRADSTSPRPPHLPVQPSTIIEHTSSPASPLTYPPSLPNIRHVFHPTSATTPPPAVPELSNPAPPIVLSREVVPLRFPLPGEIRQPSEYHHPLDQPHPLRRRLDDSGRSVGIARYSPPPLPFNPGAVQEYILNPTAAQSAAPRLQPRSSAPIHTDLPTFRALYTYPARLGTAGFVPPGITDSALQTPRPFSASPTRWPRSYRREDANGDEIFSDDEETAAEERQRERRTASGLMSQSTTDLTQSFGVSIPDLRVDGDLRPGDDQEKHGIDDFGDTTTSSRTGSAGSSRSGSRGPSRGFDSNSIRTGGGMVRIRPYPLPIHPSEMLEMARKSPPAREWRTRFTPFPPLQGSVAAARAAAQAKGSRRVSRRYAADPVGR